jgi:hypothetical protein
MKKIKLFVVFIDNDGHKNVYSRFVEVEHMPQNDDDLRNLERELIFKHYSFVGFKDGDVPPDKLPNISILSMVRV